MKVNNEHNYQVYNDRDEYIYILTSFTEQDASGQFTASEAKP